MCFFTESPEPVSGILFVMRSVRITPESDIRLKKRALLSVFLTICVSLIGFGLVIPLLPAYGQKFGATELQIGLLFASFSIAQLVASPILGEWSDRWGRRPVLILSLLGSALSFFILALAPNLAWLFVSRLVDGFTGGNITTARAYIADISEPKERARKFGLIGAAFGLGFILGPALGGALAHLGLAVPAWFAMGLSLASALLAWWWLPETVHQPQRPLVSPLRELPRLIQRAPIGSLLLINFLMWTGFSVYQTTFPLFADRRFQMAPTQVGYVLAFVGLVGVVMQAGVVGHVVRRLGERKTFLFGLGLSVAGLLGASLTHSVWSFYALAGIASAGGAMALPTFTSILSQSVSSEEQGRLQGVSGSLESLARIIGPIWGNGLLKYDTALPYASASLLLLFVGIGMANVSSLMLRKTYRDRPYP